MSNIKRVLTVSLSGSEFQVNSQTMRDVLKRLVEIAPADAGGKTVLPSGALVTWHCEDHADSVAPLPPESPVTEAELQAAATAPRVTAARLEKLIKRCEYHRPMGTTVTLCTLTLANGFAVTGQSAAASEENFNPEIGQRLALTDAKNKIWAFEGYLLRALLAAQEPGLAEYLGSQLGEAIAINGGGMNNRDVVQTVLMDLWRAMEEGK